MRAFDLVRIPVLLGVLVAGGAATAGDAAPETPATASPEERILELGRPGPEHAKLAFKIGSWDGDVLYWPFPGAAPVRSTATADNAWVLGGRFVRIEFRSTVGDEPFESLGFFGYDRAARRFVAQWMDSMSTSVLTLSGECPGECRDLMLDGRRTDPQTGRDYDVRQVVRVIDEDHHTTEFYDQLDDGTLFKSLEIRWTRRR